MKKWLIFKNTIEEIEGIGRVVVSTDSEGNIWHDTTRELKTSSYILVLDNRVIAKAEDATMLSPLENSSIFEIEGFEVGDYVYFDGLNLVKIEAPENSLYTKFDGSKWICEKSLDEQLNYYKNLIIQKTRELAVTEAAGFSDPKIEKELEELKAIHMELSHELANQINLTY